MLEGHLRESLHMCMILSSFDSFQHV